MIKQESFTTDYRSEAVSAIFKKQSNDCDFTSSGVLLAVDSNKIISVIEAARQTLLIACGELKSHEVIKALMQKADNGVRVYLLLGDLNGNQTAIDTLSGRCLVRTGVKQKGALMLVDHTTTEHQGMLLMGSDTLLGASNKDWAVLLEPQQIDDSFRSFCKLFWETSRDEFLQQNTVQKKSVHPDGSIITNHSHQLSGTLEDCLGETLNSLVGVSDMTIEREGISLQRLLGVNNPSIKQLAHTGVSLTDSWIPTLLLSDAGNWILPSSPDFNVTNWCLKLSDSQSSELEADYNQAISDAAWQYSDQLKVSDLSDKQQLRFADKPGEIQCIETHRERALKAIYTTSIDSFLNDDAKTLAAEQTKLKRDFMAHQVSYSIDIHPPYCPSQAMRDSLYDAWQEAEKNWQDQLASLLLKQKSIDSSQASISDRLNGFVKVFLLGQGQTVKKLNAEISELQKWSVTQATPAEREDYKQRLVSVQDNVIQRGKDTALKLDEAEQNHQWEQQKNKLQLKLQEAEKSLLQSKAQLDSILGRKSEQDTVAANVFSEDWKKSAHQMTDQQLESAKLKREDIESMDVSSAEEWKLNFKSKDWKKHYKNFEKALTDYQLASSKIKRNIDEVNKLVESAERAIEYAKESLDAHGLKFLFKPSPGNKAFEQQLGLKEPELRTVSYSWPDEELPNVDSELRSFKKQRFLVIFDLDNIERTRIDAERLNAEIVCETGYENA